MYMMADQNDSNLKGPDILKAVNQLGFRLPRPKKGACKTFVEWTRNGHLWDFGYTFFSQ